MNTKRFRQNILKVLTDPAGDQHFSALRIFAGGLSSAKTARLINYAVRCAEPNDVYLEVGTFVGYTLISAGYQNFTKCLGIDNFAVTEDSIKQSNMRAAIAANIGSMRNTNIRFIENDFKSVELKNELSGSEKIGVLFIDGDHSYESTKGVFEWSEPRLQDEAIVIVDDLNMHPVQKAVMEQLATGKYELVTWILNLPQDGELEYQILDEPISMGMAVLIKKRVA